MSVNMFLRGSRSNQSSTGREEAATTFTQRGPELAKRILDQYVLRQHLDNVDGQCALKALPSDAARAGPKG